MSRWLPDALHGRAAEAGRRPPGRRLRLSTLLLGLALVVLLPALALSGAAAWHAVAGQREAAEGRLRDTAGALALAVDRDFAAVTAALQALSASPAFLPDPAQPDLPALDAHARRVAEQLGAAIHLATPEGAVVLDTFGPAGGWPPRAGLRSLAERILATGRPAVGDLTESSVPGRLVVLAAVPVMRADGSVAMLVGATLLAERMRNLLTAQHLPEGVLAGMTDAQHVLVANSDPRHDGFAGRAMSPENAAQFAGRDAGFHRAVGLDGVQRAFAFRAVPGLPGWSVFVSAPVGALSAARSGSLLGVAVGAILATLIGGGLALATAQRILRPVRRLRDHALEVAGRRGRGTETAAALPPADIAEFEQLRQGFAAAEAALREREAELAGVLEATSDGVMVLDRDWRIAFVNRNGAALLEAGRELHGQVLWDAFPAAVGSPFWDAFGRSMRERVTATADARYAPLGRHFLAESHPRSDGGIVVFFRDVTEDRAAAARLAESEARFRAMADNIPQLAWMARPDGWVFWYNRRWFDFTGTTQAEMEGWGWRATQHPDHLERVEERLRRAFITGEPWEDTFPMRGRDGRYRWFLSRARPVRGPRGQIALWFGTSTDVTEQRAAEAALRDSQVRLRLALDAAGLGSWEVDLRTGTMARSGRVVSARRGLPLAGYTLEDFFREAVHPEDAPRIRAIFADLVRGAMTNYRVEYRVHRADGAGWLWMESYGGVVERDPGTGAPLRIGGVSRDVSERRAAEAAMAESEARLRLALEAGQVGTFSWNLRTGALVWDERMRALWALPSGVQPSRRVVGESLPSEERARVEAAIAAALDPGGSGRLEVEARVVGRADGTERFVAAHGRVEFAQGRPVRMFGTATDVTQIRRAAQVLAREAEQLERLAERRGRALAESQARLAEAARMEALGRLAGGIAHDFNNVLQAVQGGLKLAEKKLADDPGAVRRYISLASDAAARGAAVTGRLLSFARRGALHAEAVAPAALLDGLGEMLRHTLGPAYGVRVEAQPGMPALWADRSQLEAVLVNLANNARDAMPGGGEVLFRAEAAQRDDEQGEFGEAGLPPGGYIRLAVVDAGEGMPPEVLARVTEPFFTTKPKGQGTGLGLAMARGFAEQSGGALTIRSTPGRGTTVSLWLPEAKRVASGRAEAPAGDAEGAPPRTATAVLVAEDEREVREILVAELGERGFSVTAAESGVAALALLEAGLRPEAVVTDLAMPGGVDGLELVEEARRRLPRLPAVLVTGHAGEAAPERLESVERGGPFALVRKPAAAQVLVERLGRVLGQGRAG